MLLKGNYKQILFVFAAPLAMALVSNFYVSSIVQEQIQIVGDCTMGTTQASVTVNISEAKLLFSSVAHDRERMLTAKKNNAEILGFLKDTNACFKASRFPLPDCMKIYAHLDGEWLDGAASIWRGQSPTPGQREQIRPGTHFPALMTSAVGKAP